MYICIHVYFKVFQFIINVLNVLNLILGGHDYQISMLRYICFNILPPPSGKYKKAIRRKRIVRFFFSFLFFRIYPLVVHLFTLY